MIHNTKVVKISKKPLMKLKKGILVFIEIILIILSQGTRHKRRKRETFKKHKHQINSKRYIKIKHINRKLKDKDISRTNQTNKRVKTHRKSTKIVVFKMERISKIKIKIQFKIKNLIARMHRIVQKILRASRNRKINIQNSLKGNKRKTYQR